MDEECWMAATSVGSDFTKKKRENLNTTLHFFSCCLEIVLGFCNVLFTECRGCFLIPQCVINSFTTLTPSISLLRKTWKKSYCATKMKIHFITLDSKKL